MTCSRRFPRARFPRRKPRNSSVPCPRSTSSIPCSTPTASFARECPRSSSAASKSAEEIAGCLKHLHDAHGRALATRVNPRKARLIRDILPEALFHAPCRCLTTGFDPAAPGKDPEVFVVTAGTSDGRVALEAALTLRFLGHGVGQINDAGVAGFHRLLGHLPTLRRARAIIAVAGMEGALASVVTGLVPCPVIGVPTSTGYGVAEGGRTALHAMLSSCASGLAVVNIDNGFGAAILAHKILRTH